MVKKIDGYPADLGCEAATKHLKEQGIDEPSFCSECPFWKLDSHNKCLEDIRNQTKQLLKNSEVIEKIFELNKQGKPFCEICELYPNQSPFTIRNWLNHQAKIQKTINQYRWAIPYLT